PVSNAQLSPPNRTDAYRFSALAGDKFYFDRQNGPFSQGFMIWRLVGPHGQTVWISDFSQDVEPPPVLATGTYTLLIEGSNFNSSVGSMSYGFAVHQIDASQQAISLGGVTRGTILAANEEDRFTFTLVDPTKVSFDALTNNVNFRWSLVGSSGDVVTNRSFTASDAGAFNANPVLTLAPGEYTVVITAASGATGPYAFNLQNLEAAVLVTPGTQAFGTLEPGNETNLHRFSGAAGAVVAFDVQQLPNGLAYWRLIDPAGNQIFAGPMGDVGATTLSSTGFYTIQVEGDIRNLAPIFYDFNIVPDVDLTVDSITAPSTAQAGGAAMSISWVVRNLGGSQATQSWTDKVWLSTDQFLNPGDVELLSQGSSVSSLQSGATTSSDGLISIPLNPTINPGAYYLLVQTDALGGQPESNDANNVLAHPITVSLPPLPNLVVSNIEVVTSPVQSGNPVTVRWTISNTGDGVVAGTWSDEILLSTDDSLGGDQSFGRFAFTDTIAPGSSITRQANINLPIDLLGSRRVVVKTDVGTSSTILSQIYEHANENDNAAIDDVAVNIQLPPLPDLVIDNILVPATADSGATVPITYTLKNNGAAAATGTWRDRIYISADDMFQTFLDSEIGFLDFTGTLGAGQSITRTANVEIPISHSGARWFVVTTDMPIGSPDLIEEYLNDGNNSAIGGPTQVTLRYADLIVEAVSTATTTAQSGDTLTVSWRVRNQGTAATNVTGWFDRVLLSTSPVFDGNAPELKRIFHTGELGIDGAYTVQTTVNLTEGISGAYYMFVETDAL
ncbi:MAG: CARDB domain-containing protein, partial [Nitrospiraceae bacterium]